MNLIVIHGAPAVGKLTVANELAQLTGYKVFHNHLSIDCIKPVFDFGSPAFWRLIIEIRAATLAEAAREGIDLIHTFCYEKGADDPQFWRLIQAVEANGGEVKIVLLVCDDDERKRRIGDESRVRIGKLTDPESVGRPGKNPDLRSPIDGRKTLVIDTTSTPPDASARLIATFYELL
jgi:hypothetical protein